MVSPVGLTYAMHAILIDKYHLTPEKIGRLTDRQLRSLYFHPRTKDGAIKMPMPDVPEQPEDVMATLRALESLMSPEDHARLMQEAEAKYGSLGEPAK